MEWREGTESLGMSAILNVPFTAGLHTVSITVNDTGYTVDTEFTTVDVKSLGFPAITLLSPDNGSLNKNQTIDRSRTCLYPIFPNEYSHYTTIGTSTRSCSVLYNGEKEKVEK